MARLKPILHCLAISGITALLFTTCSHPLTETLYKEILAKKSARISDEIPAKYCIDKNSQITFVFTESMNPSTVKISGTIYEDQKEFLWRKTRIDNDTLIFKPKTQWHIDPLIEGGDKASLYISGKSRDGYDSKNIEWWPAVLDGIIYVDEKSKKEKNDTNYSVTGLGSAEHPLPSLTEAILSYKAFYEDNQNVEIHVRGGEYDTIMDLSNIKVEDSLVIRGGYDSSDWNIQQPDKNTTTLKGIINLYSNNPCSIEVARNAQLYLDGITLYSSTDSNDTLSVCISGRQNSLIRLKNCTLKAFAINSKVQEIDGIFSRGKVILENTKVDISSRSSSSSEIYYEPEKLFGIYMLESDQLDIQDSIISLYDSKSKISTAIYGKDFIGENSVNITNSIIYNPSPSSNKSTSTLVQLENIKAGNICSNTFGMNCSGNTNPQYYESENAALNILNNSTIQNCSGNIFYNALDSFKSSTWGINTENKDDIKNCKSNCFISMNTFCYKITGSQTVEYTIYGLEKSGIGFYIENASDAALTSVWVSEPLKPQSISPASILSSNLETTVQNKDIQGKIRTVPYSLGAYEIDN